MHHKLSFVAIAGCLIALGGCATLDEMNAQAEAQQRAADQEKCEGYGYQAGTDAFANCMMATAHHRDMQQAIARQQDAAEKQRQADQWERDKANVEATDAQHRADAERMMNAGGSFSEPSTPSTPTGSNCTTTTTSQQSDNAGSSTTTTECH